MWMKAALGLALLGRAATCDGDSIGTGGGRPSTATSTGTDGGADVVWEPRCHDKFCFVPAGTFTIGSPPDEWGRGAFSEDQVSVTLTRSFLLQQNELTIPEWEQFGWNNPIASSPEWCQEATCPIGGLNWFDVVSYANALSVSEGRPPCYELIGCTGAPGNELMCESAALLAPSVYDCAGYRLPTEAEWEYAARAGTLTAFYSGDVTPQPDTGTCYPDSNLEGIAWYCHNSGGSSHPVGMKTPNPAGLFDMLGNGMEWMHNDDQGSYGSDPLVDPLGSMNAQDIRRELRGGSWATVSDLLRAASHHHAAWYGKGATVRLARTLGPEESW
jgi:formylglycine-generating enzyme